MEVTNPSASLHSMNSQNRHELHRTRSNNNVRQQVRDYNRSHKQPGLVSRMIDNAIGYELIGSIVALAVVGTVFAVVIK